MSLTLDGDLKNRVFVNVAQHYYGHGYEKRCTTRSFVSTSQSKKFQMDVIPGILTEVSIYTGWNSACNENLTLRIEGQYKDVELYKYLYELGETVQVNVNRYLTSTDSDYFKSDVSVNAVVSKYFPVKAFLSDTGPRYCGNDGKILKKLTLTYRVNKHSNTEYYINTTNRVYDSSVYMSGNIHGYRDNRQVFFANYVSKSVKDPVDEVRIVFMDSDESVLKGCLDTVLTASRTVNGKSKSYRLKRGVNLVDIPTSEIGKIKEIYDGDYVQCSVLDQYFMVMYRSRISYDKKKSSLSKEVECLDRQMKDFEHVKRFMNIVTGSDIYHGVEIEKSDQNVELMNQLMSLSEPDNFSKENYQALVEMDVESRDRYEYMGMLCYEQDEGPDGERLAKRIKRSHDRLGHSKLLKTTPYSVIDLAKKIHDKPSDLQDVDNKLKVLSSIESGRGYWKNCSIFDIDRLRGHVVDSVRVSEDASPEDKKKHRTLKRKRALMNGTDETVF